MFKDLLYKKVNKAQILEELTEMHGFDLSVLFTELKETERRQVLKLIDSKTIAVFFAYLTNENALFVLNELTNLKKIEVLNEQSLDDLVDFIKFLQKEKEDEYNEIITKLTNYKEISNLLQYREDKTGAYMSKDALVVFDTMDVKVATRQVIEHAQDAESISTLIVTSENGVFKGVLSLKTLVKTRSPKQVSELIEPTEVVYDIDNIEESAATLNNTGKFQIPVVSKGGIFLGVLNLDDILDVVRTEADKDIAQLSLLSAKSLTRRKIFAQAITRLPWLILLILLSIPLSFVTSVFEPKVSKFAYIAIITAIQPLILGCPGNVSSQILSGSLVRLSRFGKIDKESFLEEFKAGLYTALTVSALVFGFSFLFILSYKNAIPKTVSIYRVSAIYAFINSLTLLVVLIMSPLIAMLIPMFFKKIKINPASAAGPIITTVCDTLALVAHFTLTLALVAAFKLPLPTLG